MPVTTAPAAPTPGGRKQYPRLVTPEGRLMYLYLDRPDQGREFSDNKYKATIAWPKGADLSALRDALAKAARMEWGDDVDLASLQKPFRDGDEKGGQLAGQIYLCAKVNGVDDQGRIKGGPQVVDAEGARIAPDAVTETCYAGCYGRVSITFLPYRAGTVRGVTAILGNVQKLRDGERLGGGRPSAADDFGAPKVAPSEFTRTVVKPARPAPAASAPAPAVKQADFDLF
jgi:hypothetical protein